MKNLNQLTQFIYEANINGYANDAKRIAPQRPGFKELEYSKQDWYMRDSYAGHYLAPGQTVIYYKGTPIWAMSYSGGMRNEYHSDKIMANKTYEFLKEALLNPDKDLPLRGPKILEKGQWKYLFSGNGDVANFSGKEEVLYKNKVVFEQNIISCLII